MKIVIRSKRVYTTSVVGLSFGGLKNLKSFVENHIEEDGKKVLLLRASSNSSNKPLNPIQIQLFFFSHF